VAARHRHGYDALPPVAGPLCHSQHHACPAVSPQLDRTLPARLLKTTLPGTRSAWKNNHDSVVAALRCRHRAGRIRCCPSAGLASGREHAAVHGQADLLERTGVATATSAGWHNSDPRHKHLQANDIRRTMPASRLRSAWKGDGFGFMVFSSSCASCQRVDSITTARLPAFFCFRGVRGGTRA
jgi:hypothetical protein